MQRIRSRRSHFGSPASNKREIANTPKIQDLGMLDTDYAILVAQRERVTTVFRNYFEFYVKLLAIGFIVCVLTQLISFAWYWRGIWSVYVTQVERQKVLVCRYCPIDNNSIVVVKASDSKRLK